MATNPILQQIAQLLSPTTVPVLPVPFGTPPFNPNAPMAGVQQPQGSPQPQSQPETRKEEKPRGKLQKIGRALTDPRFTAFSLGTAAALNRPRQQGESQLQQLTSGVLGGYGGLQSLAMMQEAARQQALKERLSVAESMRAAAATQSQIGVDTARAGNIAAETSTIPAREQREDRKVGVQERGATVDERRASVAERQASVQEGELAQRQTEFMEKLAQTRKEYQLEVDKLREQRAKRIDDRTLAQARISVDRAQVQLGKARLEQEAEKLKADLESKGDIRRAGLVESARKAAEAQVELMNKSLKNPMTVEELEAAYVKAFNRYVTQLSLGTGIQMNLEPFNGSGQPTTSGSTPVQRWTKDAQGRPIRITSAGDR